jgi:hypothetical protein
VNNINNLTECSHVLPLRNDKVTISDDTAVIKDWLNGGGSKSVSDNVEAGKKVSK